MGSVVSGITSGFAQNPSTNNNYSKPNFSLKLHLPVSFQVCLNRTEFGSFKNKYMWKLLRFSWLWHQSLPFEAILNNVVHIFTTELCRNVEILWNILLKIVQKIEVLYFTESQRLRQGCFCCSTLKNDLQLLQNGQRNRLCVWNSKA